MKEFIAMVKARVNLAKLRLTEVWKDYGLEGRLVIAFAMFFLLSVVSGVLRYILG